MSFVVRVDPILALRAVESELDPHEAIELWAKIGEHLSVCQDITYRDLVESGRIDDFLAEIHDAKRRHARENLGRNITPIRR
jgi:hypothetical protein